MARKQREKTKLIESVQFEDFEQAKRTVTLAKFNLIRILIGLAFALAATCFTAYGLFGNPESNTWAGVAFFLAIPAYLIGGGIGKALKAAWKITKIGWFVIRVFPLDILLAIAFFIFAIFGFMFIPVIFVGLNYIQHNKTLNAAKSYLAQCGYAVSGSQE